LKLYDVPRNTKIKVLISSSAPPGARVVQQEEILDFSHVDGMYSYCKDKNGMIVHIPAWEEVEIVQST